MPSLFKRFNSEISKSYHLLKYIQCNISIITTVVKPLYHFSFIFYISRSTLGIHIVLGGHNFCKFSIEELYAWSGYCSFKACKYRKSIYNICKQLWNLKLFTFYYWNVLDKDLSNERFNYYKSYKASYYKCIEVIAAAMKASRTSFQQFVNY